MSLDGLRDKVETALESLIVRWALGAGFAVLVALGGWTLKTSFDNSVQLGQLNLMQLEADRRLTLFVEQLAQSRTERISTDTALGARIDTLSGNVNQRIDDLNLRLAEIQRQTAAIEGKLGESLPDERGGRH
jgi:hypothetical protein